MFEVLQSEGIDINIAIVGSSNLTDIQMSEACHLIRNLVDEHETNDNVIITGDARGIDSIVRQFTAEPVIYRSSTKDWSGFKQRNMEIAKNADYVYSIATKIRSQPCYHCENPNHERTGGCWTLKYAKSIGKKGEVIIL